MVKLLHIYTFETCLKFTDLENDFTSYYTYYYLCSQLNDKIIITIE